ncbi:MAG: type VI secretion system ImpA family N-terminal domain-containing protein [Desulfobacterales bacterium]|nr:type VI secretion system ImpA family N-terminal domain-containing protein [Desulfobacterales bacterium]
MDKTLLLKNFVVQENPGLALTDPRFNELSTHIQSGDYKEVANLAETIISEDIYDIRVICYFLYGVFLEHGAAGLKEIFQSILNVFNENWDAVGPVKNKEKQVTNSIKWLLKQLNRKIDYEEKKESAEWVSWQQEVDTEIVEEAIELCAELQKVLSRSLEDLASQLIDGISSLKSWLGSFLRLIYKPEPEPEEEPEQDEADQPSEAAAAAPAAAPPVSGAQVPEGTGSYHLAQLYKKIAAFQSLIEKKKYEQASLVAFDIDETIENFDPRLYFPEIFAEFSLQYSMNIQEILNSKKYVKSAEWQALKALYKVDIDRFAAMDLDLDFSQIQVDSDMGDDSGYDDGYVD